MTTPDADALGRLRRFGGDRLLRDMARVFVDEMPLRIQRAWSALGAGDASALEYAVHMMKSSAGQFGAVELQRLCAEAESLARAGRLAPVPELLAGIEREFAAFRRVLQREVPPETPAAAPAGGAAE